MNKKLLLTVLIVLATLTLAACSPRTTSKPLLPEEGAAYAAEVDETVENMLVGFNEKDYAKFTRDMDEGFLKKFETGIQEIFNDINVVGAYKSRTLDRVEDRGRDRVVVYHVICENNPDVLLEVYFRSDDPNHIVGMYWNSE